MNINFADSDLFLFRVFCHYALDQVGSSPAFERN